MFLFVPPSANAGFTLVSCWWFIAITVCWWFLFCCGVQALAKRFVVMSLQQPHEAVGSKLHTYHDAFRHNGWNSDSGDQGCPREQCRRMRQSC